MTSRGSLRTVAEYIHVGEARIALNLLTADGIPAWLDNETIVSNDWLLGQAVGNVRLMVAEADLERAASVLDSQSDIDDEELTRMALEGGEAEPGFRPLFDFTYPEGHDEMISEDSSAATVPETEEETPTADLNVREYWIERAFRASILFMILPCCAPLLTWMLFYIWLQKMEIRPQLRWKLVVAIVLHVPFLIVFLFMLRSVVYLY